MMNNLIKNSYKIEEDLYLELTPNFELETSNLAIKQVKNV